MNSKHSLVIALAIKVVIIIGISFLIGLFLVNDVMAYGKGLALGGIFTILKIQLMQTTFQKATVKKRKAAESYATLHYTIRYVLTLLVIIIGALEPTIHIVGVVIGLLSMKAAAYWQGYKEKPTPKDGSVEFLVWEDDEEENSDF
ncbi:MAG: hypothetical protein CVU84_06495 [Firmicutes bacterium HGW-Firmicutes-1]|jgi:hypothetical protein|nr:MAG: hypothetical protein CVU84_06495 [Firmicutes bacterium HGW-Firmicutes-1]